MAIAVSIVGKYDGKDIARAQRELEAMSKQARTASQKFTAFGDGLSNFGKKMSLFATLPIAAFGVAAFKAAEDAEKADKRIAQIAKSMGLANGAYTGGVARINEYAGALSRQIGVEDESIKAVQAKLMTFKALGETINVAGGSMDRATQAAYDLASAGFGSAETNATQLGKALQDPVKGLTALTRSGVTFTAAEKDRIKAMVAAGDTAQAQNLILKAIEGQVGGTAKATVTDTQKMSVAWGELQENFGKAILPIVNTISKKVIPFIDKLVNAFTSLSPGSQAAIVGVAAFVAAIGPVSFIAGKAINGIVGAKDAMLSMAGAASSTVTGIKNFAMGFSNAGAVMADADGMMMRLGASLKNLGSSATLLGVKNTALAVINGITASSFWALTVAMLSNPIVLIIAGLVALGAAFYLLWTKCEMFRNILTGAWNAIKAGAEAMWNGIKAVFAIFVKAFFGYVGAIVDGAALMFGWIPGIGPKLKEAQAKFHAFADGVVANLEGTADPSEKAGVRVGVRFMKGFKNGVESAPTTIVKVGQHVTTTLGAAVVKAAVQQGPVTGAAAVSGLLGTQGATNAAYAAGQNVGVSYNNGVASVVKPESAQTTIDRILKGGPTAAELAAALKYKIIPKNKPVVTPGDLLGAKGTGSAADKTELTKGASAWATTFVEASRKVIKSGTALTFTGVGKLIADFSKEVVKTGKVSISQFESLASAIKEKLTTALENANTQLKDAISIFDQYRDSIASGVMSGNTLADAASAQTEAVNAVAEATKAQAEAQAALNEANAKGDGNEAATKTLNEANTALGEAKKKQKGFLGFLQIGADTATVFADQVDELRKQGASMQVLQEIAALGAATGGRIIEELLIGGRAAIERTNQLVETVKGVGLRVGVVAAQQFHQAGIDAAQALVDALVSETGALQKVLDDWAMRLSRALGGASVNSNITPDAQGQSYTAPGGALMSAQEANFFDIAAYNSAFAAGLPGYANGGVIPAGQLSVVGERGPELFVSGRTGSIIPNHALGGGNTYNITVQAGVGDPRAIGEQIVTYVRKYEQSSGKVFASAS